MGARVFLFLLLASIVVGVNAVPASAQPAQAQRPPDANAAAAFIAGLEALEAGKYREAVSSFNRAVEADNENVEYVRARGVAKVLAEDFAGAIADLDRANALSRGQDREAQLWLGTAHTMSGNPMKGAQYPWHGFGIPPDYGNLVHNDMAGQYWQSRTHGTVFDKEQGRQVAVNGPVRKLFPDAARAYVQRHAASDRASAQARSARASQNVASGDWAAAIKDIAALRRDQPDDVALRARWATALLRVGDARDAREEFTRVLSVQPLWAEGYLGRAEAAAILGDERRARADLRTAAALGAQPQEPGKSKIEQALARLPGDDALGKFNAGVRAGEGFAGLVEQAVAVQRWVNGRRLRYDEAYQDRIKAFTDAIREKPQNADRLEMLARFIHYNNNVPAVWNGVRANAQQLRPQNATEKSRELGRAVELTDAALKLDPRHANAMATKGWILYGVNRANEAWGLAQRGLEAEPQNVRSLALMAQLLSDQASNLEGQAASLRAGHTETRRETRADGIYEVTTRYPPTPQQLAEAQALEARAAALRQDAARRTAEAKNVNTNVVPKLMQQGDAMLAVNDVAGAGRVWTRAYALDPDRRDLTQKMADLAKRQGDQNAALALTLWLEPMRETTAAQELKNAWDEAMRTAWRSAGDVLDRAASLDPADARVPAYRSAVLAAASGPGSAEAEQARRAAVALEEAAERLAGDSFVGAQNGPLGPIDVQRAGLILLMRLRSGEANIAAGRGAPAAEMLVQNADLETRLDKNRLVELLPSAMIPEPFKGPTVVPEAPTVASLIAGSRLALGNAYLTAGKSADALAQFRAVRAYRANWPATSDHANTLKIADSWAGLGLVEAAYQSRDYDGAWQLLMQVGRPWDMPPEFEAKRKQLTDQITAARNNRGFRVR